MSAVSIQNSSRSQSFDSWDKRERSVCSHPICFWVADGLTHVSSPGDEAAANRSSYGVKYHQLSEGAGPGKSEESG